MNLKTEHRSTDYSTFLSGKSVLIPVVALLVVGLFVLWYFVTGRLLGSALDLPPELVIPSLVLPALVAFIVSHNERLWVFLALLTLSVFIFREDDGKIKVEELLYAVFVLSGVIVWFIKEVMVFRRRILLTSFDFFFLTSWVLTNTVAVIAFLLHSGDILTFIKEFLIHVTFLLYFPLRKAVADRRQLMILIGIVVFLGVLNGIHSVQTYQQRVIESALEFGFVAARVASQETLSMVLALVSFTVAAYAKRLITFLAGAAGTAAGLAFVVMSLSRGPIASTVVGLFVIIALVPWSKGKRLVFTFIGIVGFNLGALMIVAPTFADSILDNIGDRLATLNKLQGDKSLSSRVAESKALLEEHIPASPLLGYGYGVRYTFYDPPFSNTAHVYFIHNGYVYPFYKFGIPVGLFFLFMLCYPLLKTLWVHPARDSEFPRALMVGAFTSLLAVMTTNLTSSKFAVHVDTGVFVMIFVAFDYLWRTMPGTTRSIAVLKG